MTIGAEAQSGGQLARKFVRSTDAKRKRERESKVLALGRVETIIFTRSCSIAAHQRLATLTVSRLEGNFPRNATAEVFSTQRF